MNKEQPTKAGFVAIIGKPNVGKSTLLNAVLGTKLSIVTSKPQTTRKRILGIYTRDNTQIVFFDTPGILKPRYELHRSMMGYINDSLETADIILVMLDATRENESNEFFNTEFLATLKKLNKPVVVAINKMDILHNKKKVLPLMANIHQSGFVQEIVPLSALENDNVRELIGALEKHVPEHDFYYDEEVLSEQPERFFVSELIREAVFTAYRDEIPYSTEVQIVEFKEREVGKWYISADIIVERDTQKGIIIGKGGTALKQVGEKARAAIEAHLAEPVFLELFVKVREDWRNNRTYLSSYGY